MRLSVSYELRKLAGIPTTTSVRLTTDICLLLWPTSVSDELRGITLEAFYCMEIVNVLKISRRILKNPEMPT